MSKNKWLAAWLVALLCSPAACAQQSATRIMGLDELFRLADEQSTSIQTYRTGQEAADAALQAAKARRLPDIEATVSISYLGNGRLWERDFTDGTRIDMPHFGNNFAIEARQVVYAGGSIDAGIRLARLEQQAAGLHLQQNRQDIRFLLAGHYLDIYKLDNQLTALHRNLKLTEQLIADMHVRLSEGTALRNDITRYELQREELLLQIARTKDLRSILNYQLATSLRLPSGTIIAPDSTLLACQIDVLTETDWQQMATQSNAALRLAALDAAMASQRVRLEQAERRPQISLMAADHLDGPITIEVPVLNNNFNYWYVGVGVKYSFSSLFKNNRKLRQAQAEARRARQRQLLAQEQTENSVQAGYVDLLTAFTDLRTRQKAVELADQNYAVTSERYRNELALLTDMLDASDTKLSADLELVNARINIVYHYYKLKYLTHTL